MISTIVTMKNHSTNLMDARSRNQIRTRKQLDSKEKGYD